MNINSLIGRTVTEAKINQEKDLVVLQTNKGPLFLTWVGDCCAVCHLEHVSNSEALINSEITSAENTEWKDVKAPDEYGYVTEGMGTTIKTTKGTITFESRVSHNGYYSGKISVSDRHYLSQWDIKTVVPSEMKLLKDF